MRRYCSVLAIFYSLLGANHPDLPAAQPDSSAGQERTVELFDAIAAKEVQAELIAPSASQVHLRVTNHTNDLLTIQLPEAFGGVPILAQFQPNLPGGGMGQGFGQGFGPGMGGPGMGFGQFGNGGMGAMGGNGSTQALGGGFGQGNGLGNQVGNGLGNQFGNGLVNQFGNGNGRRGGLFRVLPGRVGKITAQSMCLEHGKPDPSSRIKYAIVPMDQLPMTDARVTEICKLLGRRLISQPVAQAAAWHLTDGLSWESLAAKNRLESRYTGNIKYFTPEDLAAAQMLLEQIDPPKEDGNKSLSSSGTAF